MLAVLGILRLLAGDRADRFRRHAGAQVGLTVALVVFLLLAAGFGLTLGVYLLSLKVGLDWALGIGLVMSLLAAGIVALIRQIEARQHRERQAEAARRDRTLLTEAALAAFGGAGARSALVLALAALAMGLVGGAGKPAGAPPPDDTDKPAGG